MDQPLVQRQAVGRGFSARAGLTPTLHHVVLREALGVRKISQAGVGAHLQRGVIDHQRRHRHARRQHRQTAATGCSTARLPASSVVSTFTPSGRASSPARRRANTKGSSRKGLRNHRLLLRLLHRGLAPLRHEAIGASCRRASRARSGKQWSAAGANDCGSTASSAATRRARAPATACRDRRGSPTRRLRARRPSAHR